MLYQYEEIPSNLKQKYIGSGTYGRVYKTSDNRVYKQFKYPNQSHDHVILMHDLGLEVPSDIFVFPEDLVFKKEKLMGYLTRFINGNSFDYMRQDIKLSDLISELKRLEREVVVYSSMKVYLSDFHQGNLFFGDDNKTYVLDTDDFFYYSSDNESNTLERNLVQISYPIINGVLDGQISFKNKKLNYDKNTCFLGGILSSDFINEVINELSLYSESDIETVGDLQEGISLILK